MTADNSAHGEARSHYSPNLEPQSILKPGTQAPDFSLRSMPNDHVFGPLSAAVTLVE
jgi:hypothetical protein